MGDFGDDSDDSDGEGGLGNVNRLIMRPPGHSGKAKRGHLCFDASFETGNLGRVDLINEYEYDLFIRPDTCNPKFRFWFNFTVDNVKLDQRVIFNIVNINKYRNAFNDKLTPVVKSTSRLKWQRIPKEQVYYQRSAVHQGHYILSFSFGFDKEDEVFQFALAPPYSYSKLQQYLSTLECKMANIERELLGNSVQNRRLDLLTVASTNLATLKEKKRVVVIMARVHPGESPASFVCQGLIELLISSHPIVAQLKEYVIFKIIPMLNPDGVFLGNDRSSLMGYDLNRSWNVATAWAHPTIKATLDFLITLDKDKDAQLDFVLDLHAHSNLNGCFIYGNTYEDVYRYERHIVFPKLLATTADDYCLTNMMFNADINKFGTARRYLCNALSNRVNCYTYEVSIYGYRAKDTQIVIPYTEESYIRCGRNLVKTFLEYYRAIGLIPINVVSEIKDKKKKRLKVKRKKLVKQCNSTTRDRLEVHLMQLNICNGDTSGEETIHSYQQNFGTFKQSGLSTHLVNKHDDSACAVSTFVVIPEPKLSVIDFNVITRDFLNEAAQKNEHRKNAH